VRNALSKKIREESPMNASEKFLRFADECEVMASIARDRESRLMWQSFAARWSRHAQSVDTRLARRVVKKTASEIHSVKG
jgi:hypothetical protein